MGIDLSFSTFVSDGRRLSVAVAGGGSPILLLPGICMSHRRWLDVGYVDALAATRTVICLDPLGHGESEHVHDSAAYLPDHLAAHILGAIDHLGFDSVDVWGYSRGAMMAVHTANIAPARFNHVVAGGIPLFDVEAVLRELGLAASPETIKRASERVANGDWDGFWDLFPLPLPDTVKRMFERTNDLGSVAAAGQARRLAPMVYSTPPVPILAYWGGDELFHQPNLDAASLPENSALETAVLEGGHTEVFQDLPASLRVVSSFLDRQTGEL